MIELPKVNIIHTTSSALKSGDLIFAQKIAKIKVEQSNEISKYHCSLKKLDKINKYREEREAKLALVNTLIEYDANYHSEKFLFCDSYERLVKNLRREFDGLSLDYINRDLCLEKKSGTISSHDMESLIKIVRSSDFKKRHILSKMVTVNKTSNIDEHARKLVIKELDKLPASLIFEAYNQGMTVVITHDDVTTYRTDLLDESVPGHDRSSWIGVPGVGAYDNKETVIALKFNISNKCWEIPDNHGSCNLILHEFGHSVDRILGVARTGMITSETKSFYRAWYADFNLLDGDYYQGNESDVDFYRPLAESYAEAFALTFNDNNEIKWPHIQNYIREKFI